MIKVWGQLENHFDITSTRPAFRNHIITWMGPHRKKKICPAFFRVFHKMGKKKNYGRAEPNIHTVHNTRTRGTANEPEIVSLAPPVEELWAVKVCKNRNFLIFAPIALKLRLSPFPSSRNSYANSHSNNSKKVAYFLGVYLALF